MDVGLRLRLIRPTGLWRCFPQLLRQRSADRWQNRAARIDAHLSRLLDIDDSAGLTLMVLKRAREAVYNAIGLIVLARAGYSLFPKDVS